MEGAASESSAGARAFHSFSVVVSTRGPSKGALAAGALPNFLLEPIFTRRMRSACWRRIASSRTRRFHF